MARLLVIDDDELVLGLIVKYLEDAGHEVQAASRSTEAVDLFRGSRIDAVITDILMPDQDGLELIRALIDEDPDVKILAISGGGVHGPDLYLPTAHHLGALRTLAKPFEREQLVEAVQNLLARPAA